MGVTGRMGRLLIEEVRAADAVLAGGVSRPGSSAIVDRRSLIEI